MTAVVRATIAVMRCHDHRDLGHIRVLLTSFGSVACLACFLTELGPLVQKWQYL